MRERDGHRCRICRRRAGSVHEVVPKSLGGKVTMENSIAVCGVLVGTEMCCHTLLQNHSIDPGAAPVDANEPILWMVKTVNALRWIGLELQALPVLITR